MQLLKKKYEAREGLQDLRLHEVSLSLEDPLRTLQKALEEF
jgi:hypothetical protein